MILDYIETSRLIIREVNEADFKSIHTYASKEEVTKYLPFGPNNEIDTTFFIEKVMNYKNQSPRCDYEFAVVLKENNTLIGGCGIHITSVNNKEGSIGYCFDDEFWGKGYGSEAANAVINFGFDKLSPWTKYLMVRKLDESSRFSYSTNQPISGILIRMPFITLSIINFGLKIKLFSVKYL